MAHNFNWKQEQSINSRSFICSFCGESVGSDKGWIATPPNSNTYMASIHICHKCGKPTFIDENGQQWPAAVFGEAVQHIPDKTIELLYDEARRASGAGSYTAAVLCCRKLLMHIAVSKGASPDLTFLKQVEFLAENHYIPPDAKDWVDHIRTTGNEANHEIVIMKREDAEDLLEFMEMLLKFIYQFPATAQRRRAAKQ